MFATLLGRYPAPPLEALADQIAAGLGLLSDGGPAARPSSSPNEAGTRTTEIVARWRRAAELAAALAGEAGLDPPPVKACLALGPLRGSGDDPRASAGIAARADGIAAVMDALAAVGATVVQLEADDLCRVGPGDRPAIDAARALLGRGLRDLPEGLHVSLSVASGDLDVAVAQSLFDLPIASFALDLCAGPDDWYVAARLPSDRGLIVGVADSRTAARDEEAVMVWAARYAASLAARGPERVGLSTSIGLERLDRAQARAKLAGLAAAARLAALSDPEELKRSLDPRAIDARSAALGRYEPGHQRDVSVGRPAADGGDG